MRETDRLANWRRALLEALATWRLRWTRRSSVPTPDAVDRGHPYRDTSDTRRRRSRPSKLDDGDILLLAPVLYWVGLALVARPDAPLLWIAGAGAPLLVLVVSALRDGRPFSGERSSSQPTPDARPRKSEEPR